MRSAQKHQKIHEMWERVRERWARAASICLPALMLASLSGRRVCVVALCWPSIRLGSTKHMCVFAVCVCLRFAKGNSAPYVAAPKRRWCVEVLLHLTSLGKTVCGSWIWPLLAGSLDCVLAVIVVSAWRLILAGQQRPRQPQSWQYGRGRTRLEFGFVANLDSFVGGVCRANVSEGILVDMPHKQWCEDSETHTRQKHTNQIYTHETHARRLVK